MPEQGAELSVLEGTVSSLIFQNEENGYTILRLDVGEEEMTVVGSMPGVSPGEYLTVRGPVSYTHLDVYKRQGRRKVQYLPEAENDLIIIGGADGPAYPVDTAEPVPAPEPEPEPQEPVLLCPRDRCV